MFAHLPRSLKKLDKRIAEEITVEGTGSVFRRPAGRNVVDENEVYGRTVRLSVIQRNSFSLEVIDAWLHKKREFDSHVLEALSKRLTFFELVLGDLKLICADFLDHLIREGPASRFASTKRAYFFDKLNEMPEFADQAVAGATFTALGFGASVYRGIFQTIRPSPVRTVTLDVSEDLWLIWF